MHDDDDDDDDAVGQYRIYLFIFLMSFDTFEFQ